MQMLITRTVSYISVLFCLLINSIQLCSANTAFIEQFQIKPPIDEKIADRITSYYSEDIPLPLEQQKIELFKLESQLNNISSLQKDKAVYWFIRGLQQQNMASYYIQLKDIPSANSHIARKNNAYKKAIELDKITNNRLSASIYSTMKHGLPQSLKIEATKKELALGGNGENESYYWYLHWSNIDQLKKAGREKEAEAAYKNMQRELKNSGQDLSIYNDLSKKIKKVTLKKTAPQKQQADNKHEKTKQETRNKEKPDNTKYIIIFSIVLLSILILIAVTIYEVLQKRKK